MTLEEVVKKELALLNARIDALLPENYEYNSLCLQKLILETVLKEAEL